MSDFNYTREEYEKAIDAAIKGEYQICGYCLVKVESITHLQTCEEYGKYCDKQKPVELKDFVYYDWWRDYT